MANTATLNQETDPSSVIGRFRYVAGTLTMTDGPGAVATGLEYIAGGSVTPLTVATGGFGAIFNSTSNGSINVRSCASADTFNFNVFGY